MAGIYIHVPFCRRACNYCNFYFSTSLGNKERFLRALCKEIALTSDYLNPQPVETLYAGGGTPSLLTIGDWKIILDALHRYYSFNYLKEFTVEANPDDLQDAEYLRGLQELGVNRLSIGVQSFFDDDLRYMQRVHTADDTLRAVKSAQDAGFTNISLDLIYGVPTLSHDRWVKNLELTAALQVPHFSAYCLTVEPKTTLENKIRKKILPPATEEHAAEQLDILMHEATNLGYEQYEISNFAREGRYSLHNSAYWSGKKYLGLGPSAHSFNGTTRSWNVRNNIAYITALEEGRRDYEEEVLSPAQRINETIMTGLRTAQGVNTAAWGNEIKQTIHRYLQQINPEYYTLHGDVLTLTRSGKFFADRIAAALFLEESDVSLP
ncbi:MAG: radical SAM family heme chaperone HemW [Chitinophagales bacterium]|nr:radical SAM family heme chaperone HemW [Chitinophagales bacterium]